MSKDGVTLTIEPANGRTNYFFGEQIPGKVVVENTGAAKCRSVVVRLRAQIVVRLDNTAATVGDSSWNKVFPLVSERGPQLELWSEHKSAQRQLFPSGVTELPFVFETRAFTQMPPAYESMKGAVRWYLEVVFVRPFRSDFYKRIPLQMLPAIPVDAPAYMRPVTKTKTEALRSFMTNKGQIVLQITLDRGGYLPQQPIQVAASVINQSREQITAVVLDVTQCTVCFDGGSRRCATNMSLFSTDCLTNGMVLGPNQQLPIQQTVFAPTSVPSFLHGNIAVNYTISIRVRAGSSGAELACPFVLGSWPPAQSGPAMSGPAMPAVSPQPVPSGPSYYGAPPAGPAGQPQQPYYPSYSPQQPQQPPQQVYYTPAGMANPQQPQPQPQPQPQQQMCYPPPYPTGPQQQQPPPYPSCGAAPAPAAAAAAAAPAPTPAEPQAQPQPQTGLPPSSVQPVPVYDAARSDVPQKPLPQNPAAPAPEQPASLYPDLLQDAAPSSNSAPVEVLPSTASVEGTAPPAE